MNFEIYSGDSLVYNSRSTNQNYALGSPHLKLELNKAGTLEFSIFPTHPMYNSFKRMSTYVTVYRDNEEVFRGRVLQVEDEMYMERKIQIEGDLAYLVDSLQYPDKVSEKSPISPMQTMSGNVLKITNAAPNMNYNEIVVNVAPIQNGSGNPSASNIRPISGRTTTSIYRTGNNLLECTMSTRTVNGVTATVNSDGTIILNGTATGDCAFTYGSQQSLKLGYGYILSGAPSGSGASTYRLAVYSGGWKYDDGFGVYFSKENAADNSVKILVAQGCECNNVVFYPQIRAGLNTGEFEAYNGTSVSFDWQSSAGTVYGGTLNATTGVLTITDGYIASYNGETLPSTWISDRDVYIAGAVPSTGAQVVYKLETPTTYQLTGAAVQTIGGTNYIWSDAGDTSATYTSSDEIASLGDLTVNLSKEKATHESLYDHFVRYIAVHNSQMESVKQFIAGNVTIDDAQTEQDFSASSFRSTMSAIESDFLKVYGGYLVTRKVNDDVYLDWLKEPGTDATQQIKMGVNLLELQKKDDSSDIFTVLVPVGDDQLTIADANNGSMVIENSTGVAQYGRIYKTVSFSGVKDTAELLRLGQVYMDTNYKGDPISLEIKALDMNILNGSIEAISLGSNVEIISAPHNVSIRLTCTSIDYDIQSPENNIYEFGDPNESLSSKTNSDSVSTKSSTATAGQTSVVAYNNTVELEKTINEHAKRLDEFIAKVNEMIATDEDTGRTIIRGTGLEIYGPATIGGVLNAGKIEQEGYEVLTTESMNIRRSQISDFPSMRQAGYTVMGSDGESSGPMTIYPWVWQ